MTLFSPPSKLTLNAHALCLNGWPLWEPRFGQPIGETIYRQELPRIYNYFRYRMGDDVLAEDLTSIAFQKTGTAPAPRRLGRLLHLALCLYQKRGHRSLQTTVCGDFNR